MKEYLLKLDVLEEITECMKCCSQFVDDDFFAILDHERMKLQKMKTYQLQDKQAEPNGQWLPNDNRDAPTYDSGLMIRYFHCSVCNGDISDRYGKYRYCPHCGARMED